jgi:hypothetical protein
MSRLLPLLLIIAIIAGCGGGGGGGAGAPVSLFGRVLWVETGAGVEPAATIRSGEASTLSSTVDGSFQLDTSSGVASITITWTEPGTTTPIVRTFNFEPKTANADLGDIYIGPETVSVQGRAVSTADSSPIAGGLVKMAGVETVTAADGTFSLDGVAYSPDALAVFLGLQGSIARTGYFTKFFSPPSGASAGLVEVGDVAMTPEGSDDPPPPPFNIEGTVLPVGEAAGATVELKSGANIIRTATADGAGKFYIWAPVGTYTLEAENGGLSGTAGVTVTSVNEKVTQNVTIS